MQIWSNSVEEIKAQTPGINGILKWLKEVEAGLTKVIRKEYDMDAKSWMTIRRVHQAREAWKHITGLAHRWSESRSLEYGGASGGEGRVSEDPFFQEA